MPLSGLSFWQINEERSDFMKKLIILAVLLLIVLLPAGCSTSSTTTTTSTPATTISQTTTTTQAQSIELNLSAAASLTDALQEINTFYMQENKNIKIVTNFASSGTLQKQIEQGAPADIFFSAGASQMNALQTENLTLNDTRKNLLTNKVVLVVPKNSTLSISSFSDLTRDDVQKIAIGDPASVPAGTYGKQAFDQLGIYDQIQSKLILCTDVKQVLSYVEAGNVDAGIVYSTDAALSTSVNVVANAPDEVNAKVVYPIAVIKGSKNADAAKAYIAFLAGAEAKAIFEKYGFVVVQS
jgi:molybdate transport system substrate-binding protein